MKRLLVVVDYQKDFVDSALGFEGAEKLEQGIWDMVETTLSEGGYVLFTRDTHDENYLQTREGSYLPVPHCVKGTAGHSLFGRLSAFEDIKQHNVTIVDKETFGSKTIGAEAESLCGGSPDEVCLCGLVTDICVVSNAIILHTAFPGAKIRVIENLVSSANSGGAAAAITVMRGLGIEVS